MKWSSYAPVLSTCAQDVRETQGLCSVADKPPVVVGCGRKFRVTNRSILVDSPR